VRRRQRSAEHVVRRTLRPATTSLVRASSARPTAGAPVHSFRDGMPASERAGQPWTLSRVLCDETWIEDLPPASPRRAGWSRAMRSHGTVVISAGASSGISGRDRPALRMAARAGSTFLAGRCAARRGRRGACALRMRAHRSRCFVERDTTAGQVRGPGPRRVRRRPLDGARKNPASRVGAGTACRASRSTRSRRQVTRSTFFGAAGS